MRHSTRPVITAQCWSWVLLYTLILAVVGVADAADGSLPRTGQRVHVKTMTVAEYEISTVEGVSRTNLKHRTVTAYARGGRELEKRVVDTDGSSRTCVYSYDSRGRLAAEHETDGAGDTLARTELRYDPAGRLVERTTRDKAGTILRRWVRMQAPDGRSAAETLDGVECRHATWLMCLDSGGRILRREELLTNGTPGLIDMYRYTASGQLAERSVILYDGRSLGYRMGITYDSLGRDVVVKTWIRGNGEETCRKTYGPAGILLEETTANGRIRSRVVCTYDARGRLLRETRYANNPYQSMDKPPLRTYREYRYEDWR